jgi:hypothetical protein
MDEVFHRARARVAIGFGMHWLMAAFSHREKRA